MDLTRELFRFCDVRRTLWNSHFAGYVKGITDPRVDLFLQIQKLLFAAIVLQPCGKGDHDLREFGSKAIEFLQVQISADVDQLEILATPSRHPSQWARQTVKRGDWSNRKLAFIDFFDWYPQDPNGRCSYPFVEVEVRPPLPGGERWLLPTEYVTIRLV